MTIKQCYQAMGADFEEISQRIPSEAMIRKFAVKFPEDKSFAELTKALEQGDVETAFRAAHTIKGLCLTLGFSHLTAPASELRSCCGPDGWTAAKCFTASWRRRTTERWSFSGQWTDRGREAGRRRGASRRRRSAAHKYTKTKSGR